MSLINKALKKEQQRRTGSPPDAALYTLSTHSPARARSRRENRSAAILLGFVGMGLFILSITGAFVHFGSQYLENLKANAQPATQTALASGNLAKSDANPEDATPEPAAPAAPDPTSEESAPAETDVAQEKAPQESEPTQSAATAAADKAAAEESASESSPEEVANEADLVDPTEETKAERHGDLEIWTFVDNLRIQGIRAAGPNSRLLLNGRVYKIGYTIDRTFRLKFVAADDEAVFFEDPQGRRYEKLL